MTSALLIKDSTQKTLAKQRKVISVFKRHIHLKGHKASFSMWYTPQHRQTITHPKQAIPT